MNYDMLAFERLKLKPVQQANKALPHCFRSFVFLGFNLNCLQVLIKSQKQPQMSTVHIWHNYQSTFSSYDLYVLLSSSLWHEIMFWGFFGGGWGWGWGSCCREIANLNLDNESAICGGGPGKQNCPCSLSGRNLIYSHPCQSQQR